ncbi:MAG: hypothetical protein H0W56_05590 [Acidothermales bacterium]|nr:hypothetical protein [Acidothermales bacterium]
MAARPRRHGRRDQPGPVPDRVLQARTAVWTPTVTASPREVAQALPRACQHIFYAIDYDQYGQVDPYVHNASRASGLTELLIVDEADRCGYSIGEVARPQDGSGART